ncbi:MAG: SigE family RNA polymerase sigma factor [Actinomycetota bacterium]|nr:SigE family RNA polymerase sigma factor [Actinomycetota bacterium]
MSTFDEVYLSEQRRAFKLAYLLCGELGLAEEVVADAMVSAWPRWDAGEIADLGSYVRRAVVNQMTSRFRRRSLERRLVMPRRQGAGGPEDVAVDRQVVLGALKRLPPRQRAAIVLRYYEDLPEAQIAAAMATSVGTTKAHLSRGLAKLRVLLDDGGGDR